MPFRPGIISRGEDFVGEERALSRKIMASKRGKADILFKYEDENELFDHEAQLTREHEQEGSLENKRIRYQAFWGAVRRREMFGHLDHYDACVPTTQRGWSCGTCRCGRSKFRCFCDDGKKMMSLSRIIFANSAVAWQSRNLVYEVGTGLYVPKARKESKPDWRFYSWDI